MIVLIIVQIMQDDKNVLKSLHRIEKEPQINKAFFCIPNLCEKQ